MRIDHLPFYSLAIVLLLMPWGKIYSHELVDLRSVNPHIRIDMRYTSYRSPVGLPLYPVSGCFLVREVAEKLSRVHRYLEKEGYGIKVYDAYRPYRLLGNVNYNQLGTRGKDLYPLVDRFGHSRGTAVNVTLVCIDGTALDMPSQVGHYLAALPCNQELPPHIYHNKQKLQQVMEKFGFIASDAEWWHFDHETFSCYPILDIPFEELTNINYIK